MGHNWVIIVYFKKEINLEEVLNKLKKVGLSEKYGLTNPLVFYVTARENPLERVYEILNHKTVMKYLMEGFVVSEEDANRYFDNRKKLLQKAFIYFGKKNLREGWREIQKIFGVSIYEKRDPLDIEFEDLLV